MKRKERKLVESMKAAASLIAVEVDVVRKAKEMGCEAFLPGNRIDVEALRKWIAANAEKVKASGSNLSLKDQKLNEEIRKLKIKNDRDEKLVTPNVKLHAAFAEIGQSIKSMLYQKLENEYPATVSGLDIPGCRIKGAQLADSILVEIRKLSSVFQ